MAVARRDREAAAPDSRRLFALLKDTRGQRRVMARSRHSLSRQAVEANGGALKELDTDDEMPRPRIVRAFSAGGVVFRPAVVVGASSSASSSASSASSGAADPTTSATPASASALVGAEVVLVGYLRDDTWTLPKGTPAAGETIEETALREVREETGIQARIVGDLGSIQYSFARRGVRYQKEVRHFLMEATGGDVTLHDAEYDEARWFELAEAMRRLTYVNETEVVRRAEPLIGQLLAGGDR